MKTQTKPQVTKLQLGAEMRTLFGKKLRKFRHEGKVPANVFGPNYKSRSISVELKNFSKAYKVAEETGIIYLNVDKEELPVLIRGVQRHPISHKILHVDFRKIDLTQKIETEVPVKIVGESEAVVQKGGVLLTQMSAVRVESLPEDIPHEIEVDISRLKEIGTEIKVGDLPKSNKYTVKEDEAKVVVSVIAHKEESLVAETAVAEPEVITEAPKEGEEAPIEEAAPTGKETKEAKPAEGKPEETKQGKQQESKVPDQKQEPKKE